MRQPLAVHAGMIATQCDSMFPYLSSHSGLFVGEIVGGIETEAKVVGAPVEQNENCTVAES